MLALGRSGVADLGPPHLDRADPGLNRPVGAMAVADAPAPAVGEPSIDHLGLPKVDDGAILAHGD